MRSLGSRPKRLASSWTVSSRRMSARPIRSTSSGSRRLAFHAPDRLALEQLPEELDEREDQLGDRALDVLWVGVPPRQGLLAVERARGRSRSFSASSFAGRTTSFGDRRVRRFALFGASCGRRRLLLRLPRRHASSANAYGGHGPVTLSRMRASSAATRARRPRRATRRRARAARGGSTVAASARRSSRTSRDIRRGRLGERGDLGDASLRRCASSSHRVPGPALLAGAARARRPDTRQGELHRLADAAERAGEERRHRRDESPHRGSVVGGATRSAEAGSRRAPRARSGERRDRERPERPASAPSPRQARPPPTPRPRGRGRAAAEQSLVRAGRGGVDRRERRGKGSSRLLLGPSLELRRSQARGDSARPRRVSAVAGRRFAAGTRARGRDRPRRGSRRGEGRRGRCRRRRARGRR